MPVKRRNHGRSRKNCGSSGKLVTCDSCGARPAKDKVRERGAWRVPSPPPAAPGATEGRHAQQPPAEPPAPRVPAHPLRHKARQ